MECGCSYVILIPDSMDVDIFNTTRHFKDIDTLSQSHYHKFNQHRVFDALRRRRVGIASVSRRRRVGIATRPRRLAASATRCEPKRRRRVPSTTLRHRGVALVTRRRRVGDATASCRSRFGHASVSHRLAASATRSRRVAKAMTTRCRRVGVSSASWRCVDDASASRRRLVADRRGDVDAMRRDRRRRRVGIAALHWQRVGDVSRRIVCIASTSRRLRVAYATTGIVNAR